MDNDSLLIQTLQTSKELHNNSKQCWYTGVSFIFDQLNINDSMSLDDIKYKLVKRSMHFWEKQMKEVAIDKEGKLRIYYTFKSSFKKKLYLKVIKNSDIRKILHSLD